MNIEEPYFDQNGKQIHEFAVLKVYHFTGTRKKKHYMYKWVRLIEWQGTTYYYAQHLTDASGFFERTNKESQLTGYRLKAVCDPDRKIPGTEIVQCYNEYK